MGERTSYTPGTFSEVPNDRFAALADPQGAVFTIFEGEFDD